MTLITRGGAWCNGEVAYIAWDVTAKIDGCLGFMVTRVHETGDDAGQRRILPTWVAFTDQNNPNWNQQDSSVWPIQSYEWRDLTLRKSRDTTKVRPIDFKVHYEIVPVRLAKDGDTPIETSPTAPEKDAKGLPSYEGPKHPLAKMGEPFVTNSVQVTHTYGAGVKATFTNGILSTQNLARQLESVNKGPPKQVMANAMSDNSKTRAKAAQEKEEHLLGVLKTEIAKEDSPIRQFLMGDVYSFVTDLIGRAKKDGGQVHLALYELHDKPLIALLVDAVKNRLAHVILSTAGNLNPNPKNTPKEERKPVLWDTENDDPRALLHAAAGSEKDRVIDRMFNSTARIGHNKFAVYVEDDKPIAVMTGSTNWTETGLCTQSNNCIVVDNENIAADYLAYWNRLKADKQPARAPISVVKGGKKIKGAAPNSAKQGQIIRTQDRAAPKVRDLAKDVTAKAWFSPNTAKPAVPKTSPTRPVDLDEVYKLMDRARSAIMFLVFLPGRAGVNNIVGKAANIAQTDTPGAADGESERLTRKLRSLEKSDKFVMGAISDPTALPEYKPPAKTAGQKKGAIKLPPPAIWWPGGDQSKVAIIRAAAVRIPFGNLRPELLTAGHAIIHDKIIVIDPLDKKNCTVITGSHNLGYKASYCNDENLLIIQGNRELAISYAVHVIDLYEHYLMRARLEEGIRRDIASGKLKSYEDAAAHSTPHGLLAVDGSWQDKRFPARKESSMAYFLGNA
jgi:phosphatidylserine/phosphatidylglycerophosphate/cardiolipin synthase-like enzyme